MHLTTRGNDQQRILYDATGRTDFLTRLRQEVLPQRWRSAESSNDPTCVPRDDCGLDGPNGAATLALPIGTVERDSGHSLIWSVWFIWFVLFIWLVWFNQTNQIDKRNQPEVAHRRR